MPYTPIRACYQIKKFSGFATWLARIVYGRSLPETGALALETGRSASSSFCCKSAHPDFIQIRRSEFTILIGAVIGSAIIPTIVAQRWFAPPLHALRAEEIVEVEDEEFEPPRPRHAKTPDLGA